MRFSILGPLVARGEEGPLTIGGQKQRGLLTLLLLRANQTVSTDWLIDGLWGEAPPDSAGNALQVYVSGLRKLLGPDVLLTKAPGYELRVDPDDLDLTAFERGAASGRELLAAGELETGVDRLTEALALWRGPPFDGIDLGPLGAAEAARLGELRLAATEERIDAELALGRHARLVAELETLVAEHPLRERLYAQLALALYRSGRQADALAVHRALRGALVDQLGIEPSPALRSQEQSILRQDPALDLEAPRLQAGGVPTRKPVTALVLEIDASTSTGVPLDPEAEESLVSSFAGELVAIPRRHGAAAERIGPSLAVALFGVPAVREDDALQAARAALEVQEQTPGVIRAAEARGVTLSIRIAVASGEAIVGDEPPSAVTGWAVVREAQRLCREGEPGEIVLSSRTRALLEGAAHAEPAGHASWRLLGLAPDAEAITRRFDSPLVGRKRELARLRKALEEVTASRTCALVAVLGPPGIGKSRLTRELLSRVDGEATTAIGRCLDRSESATYRPLGEIVRRLAGEDVQAGLATLLRGERQGALAAKRIAAALGEVDARVTPEETAWAVRRLFEALARRRPLVVCVEDAHWADPAFLDLVDYLHEWTRAAPVLLLVTGRPELLEERPTWDSARAGSTTLQLGPLGEREVASLIGDVLGPAAADETLCRQIAEAAEGNPLFVEQMAAMLGEDLGKDERPPIPPTIHALLAARLDLLPAGERTVLERAAVVGREFEVEPLSELVREAGREEVVGALERLWRRQLVDAAAEGTFRFRHQLIADAAYEGIPKAVRAALHEELAEWIQAGRGDGQDGEEVVGYHLERAYRTREQIEPPSSSLTDLGMRGGSLLASAGRRAIARGNLPSAVGLLTRASALPARDEPSAVELTLSLVEAMREAGDLAGASARVQEAAEAAARIGRRDLAGEARVLELRIRIATEPEAGADLLQRAMEAIAELEQLDDERGLAEAWYIVAWSHWLACKAAESEEALAHAIRHARAVGSARLLGTSVGLLLGAGVLGSLPVPDAIRRCEDALGEDSVPLRVEFQAHRALGALLALQGRFEEARAHLEQDRRLVEDAGLRIAWVAGAEIRGYVELLAGDPVAAERALREGIDRVPDREMSAYSTLAVRFGEALFRQGRLDEALEWIELAGRVASPHDLSVQVQREAATAKVLAVRGVEDEAKRLAASAVERAGATDFMLLQGEALLDAAEVMRLSLPDAEADLLDRAAACFEQKGAGVLAAETHARLDAAAGLLVRPKA